ncbi:flagellar protein FliT [Massilia sp. TS11]|uniref:flagellar protein FliT n=1 Tax=Massilia sp. TS11 TaxID=2908003 RepID=UPI001EDBF5FC|nr:flagellar protein FliT [Massilia sp. TS11]MCG2582886.1 flagellar protein FliT [Massilia sp. TS11]
MMTSQEVLATYEAMAVLTRQMVAAASDNDWDQLVQLEQRCAAHVDQLRAHEPAQALAGDERERKLEAIRQMLEDDRKIRDLTMPWMARLSALIGHSGTQRRLAQAYRA